MSYDNWLGSDYTDQEDDELTEEELKELEDSEIADAGHLIDEPVGCNTGSIDMPIDFSKHKKGDVVRVHCCDDCVRNAGVQPKYPPDSGKESWLCEVCGHFGIGSATDCKIGDWLSLQPNAQISGGTPSAGADCCATKGG